MHGTTAADINLTPMGIRIRAGMISCGARSVSEFARRVGVSRQTMQRWLCDPKISVDARSLFALADEVHMDPRWILTGEGSPAEAIKLSIDEEYRVRKLLAKFGKRDAEREEAMPEFGNPLEGEEDDDD